MTRVSTEGLPRLDVRVLARAGMLRPGTFATVWWNNDVSITTEVTSDDPPVITLLYCVSTPNKIWLSLRDDVGLTTTPCRYGSTRVWFSCPGCGSRCAVLYALGGRFRCRTCHRLAYASTRSKLQTVP